MPNPSILMVEDNAAFAGMVKEFLEPHGFRVSVERRGDGAAERILSDPPDLVLLDILLPGMDGLSVCRHVRSRYPGPILMLTSLDEEVDEVTGLQTGADDYVIKPIRPQVLLARIRNLLARVSQRGARAGSIDLGEIVVDSASRSVRKGGETIILSSAEFDLLYFLAQHAGSVVTRDEIYRNLRGMEYDGLDRTMDVRIARLRAKLGDDARAARLIKRVRGEGYLLAKRS